MQVKPTVRIRTTSYDTLREVADAIHVSNIMTPRDEFEYCKPDDLLVPKLELMKEGNLDVIPMLRGLDLKDGNFHEYLSQENAEFKIEQRSKCCKDAAMIIEREDRIPENLMMEEAILMSKKQVEDPILLGGHA